MEFYRFEKDGVGPYAYKEKDIQTWLIEKDILDNYGFKFETYIRDHPSYWTDRTLVEFFNSFMFPNLKNRNDYIFGFNTLDQLLAWFNNYNQMEYLKTFGFKLSIYDASDYCISDYQMIANKQSLRLIDTISL